MHYFAKYKVLWQEKILLHYLTSCKKKKNLSNNTTDTRLVRVQTFNVCSHFYNENN